MKTALEYARLCAEELLKDPDDPRVIAGILNTIPLVDLLQSTHGPGHTPNATLPPIGDAPRRKMLIEIEVSEDFEKRLDNQWMVEREIHSDRWNWFWRTEIADEVKPLLELLKGFVTDNGHNLGCSFSLTDDHPNSDYCSCNKSVAKALDHYKGGA